MLLEEQDNYLDTLTPLMKERLFMRMQQVWRAISQCRKSLWHLAKYVCCLDNAVVLHLSIHGMNARHILVVMLS